MLIEIKNRYNGNVIFSHDCEENTLKITLDMALKAQSDLAGVDLTGADLRYANLTGFTLRGADLRGADLRYADLTGFTLRGADLRYANLMGATLTDVDLTGVDLRYANLMGANLAGANLTGVDLTGVDLTGVDLRYANLRYVDLTGVDLTGVDLTGANLTYANLRYANLMGVDLTDIRDDMFAVLSAMPSEVIYLIESLKNGGVDGSTYQGKCACLVGTLANARGVEYRSIDGVAPNSSRPIERFFMNIKEGDTPETNQCSKFALEWAESWLARMQAAFSPLVIK